MPSSPALSPLAHVSLKNDVGRTRRVLRKGLRGRRELTVTCRGVANVKHHDGRGFSRR
jgi:hypothetical protein